MLLRINCVKQLAIIGLHLIIVLLVTEVSFAQPKIITIEKYNQLFLRQQIDTASFYQDLYLNYPDKYPGQKLPLGFGNLIKAIISSSSTLLNNNSQNISIKDKATICQNITSLYFISAFFNKDSVLFYADKGFAIIGNDTSLWNHACHFWTFKNEIYQLTLNDFVKAADAGKQILQIATLHGDTLYIGIGYLTIEHAYYYAYDSLTPVEDYCLKAAALFKNNNAYMYNYSMNDAIEFLIDMYRKYNSTKSLQQTRTLHTELAQYSFFSKSLSAAHNLDTFVLQYAYIVNTNGCYSLG